ncbi:MAG: trypsin-like peptidase domain-containing protein [Pseudanabaenaceae cyanobacterium]
MTHSLWFSTAIIGIATIPAIVQPAYGVRSSEEVAQIAKSVTVAVKIPDGNGSGTLIKRHNGVYTVLTAYHVIKDVPASNISVTTPDGKTHSVISDSVQQIGGLDVAIFQFRSQSKYAVIEFGDPKKIAIGQRVFVAGFPQSDSGIPTTFVFLKGDINSILSKPIADGYQLLYSNETKSGMSGGPVMNREGKLIAIHGISDNEGALKGGIPISLFAKELKAIPTPRPTSNPITGKPTPAPSNDQQKAERFFNLGLGKQYHNRHREAIRDYTEAIRLRPTYASAYNNRGLARMSERDYPQALADYNQAIRLRPDLATAYFNRGQIFVLMGRRQEALGDFQIAAKYARQKGMRYLHHRSRERIRDLLRQNP